MARRNNAYSQTETLRDRLYQQELDRWSYWLSQQERLRELLPRAIDLLGETLDAGGPEAVKLALALVRMTDVAAPAEKPHRNLLQFAGEEELAARLAARIGDEADIPVLTSGV